MAELTDRLAGAVRILVGDCGVKQRLVDAYEQYLSDVDPSDLAPAQRPRFEELGRELRSVAPLGTETPARASVRKMSAADAARCAELILELYASLLGQAERAEPLKVVRQSRGGVPRYVAGG